MNNLHIKRGDAFSALAHFCDVQGAALSLDGYTVEATLKDSGYNQALALNVQVTDAAAGEFELRCSTSNLPTAQYLLEIAYIKNGDVNTTCVLGFNVQKVCKFPQLRYAQVESLHGLTKINIKAGVANLIANIFNFETDFETANA